jgi:uncharacterized protein YndB with AHSA1/START domain
MTISDRFVYDVRYRLAQLRATATTRIACPPERVFDMLADLRHETEWNSRVSRAELVSDEPIGLGSRFAVVNGGTPFDVTITTFDRPSLLVCTAAGKPDVTATYRLSPTEEGTELEGELDFRPTGPLKALFFLLAPVIRRDVPKQYASLKALCEG